MYGLKPVPFKTMSFSVMYGLKLVPSKTMSFSAVMYGLKLVPFTETSFFRGLECLGLTEIRSKFGSFDQ